MSSASNFTENLALKFLLTADTATRPTTWYVALFNNTSTAAASNLEFQPVVQPMLVNQ